jgi:transposase
VAKSVHDLVTAKLGRDTALEALRAQIEIPGGQVSENLGWGYRRLHGELLVLGVKVAASTVWEILKEAGIDPAPTCVQHVGRLPALPGRRPAGL